MAILPHGGSALASIHKKSNSAKQEAYWLGFLSGVIASKKIEDLEIPAIRAEAMRFLELIGDEDAGEILRDLDSRFSDHNKEVYAILESIVEQRSADFDFGNSKNAINRFLGFCAGIACDNRISLEEVERLIEEIERFPADQIDDCIRSLRRSAERAIADRKITPAESEDIATWITRLVGDSCADTGLSTFGNMPVIEDQIADHRLVVFGGNVFVVTGTFAIAPRKVIHSRIVELGGDVAGSVTRKTRYLVVGSEASRDWVRSHSGNKLIKARELRQEGGLPHIVGEAVLKQAFGGSL